MSAFLAFMAFVCAGLTGACVMWVWLYKTGQLKSPEPYKWVCSARGCRFSVSTNDYSVTQILATDHTNKFHKEI